MKLSDYNHISDTCKSQFQFRGCCHITFHQHESSLRSGLEFDMKYHILHDFRTSTSFKEKYSHYSKDRHRTEAPSARIRFHIVFIETANLSLCFHMKTIKNDDRF